jgi:hypothetical protein
MFVIPSITGLLLSISGFGINPNPRAPAAVEVLKYAPTDTMAVLHLDLVPLLANYPALVELSRSPLVDLSPDLASALTTTVREIDSARNVARVALSMDILTDVTSATVFLTPGGDQLRGLAVVRGKIPPALFTLAAGFIENATVDTERAIISSEGVTIAMVGSDLLLGSSDLVEERLAASWKPTRPPAGSLLARSAATFDKRPFLVVIGDDRVGGSTPEWPFALASVEMYHNSLRFLIDSKSASDHTSAVLLTEAIADLMRGIHAFPRGLARMLLAALPHLRQPRFHKLVASQSQLLAFLGDELTSSNLKVTFENDRRAMRAGVKVSARSIAHVIPVMSLCTIVAIGLMVEKETEAAPPAPARRPTLQTPQPPRPSPSPAPRKLPGPGPAAPPARTP